MKLFCQWEYQPASFEVHWIARRALFQILLVGLFAPGTIAQAQSALKVCPGGRTLDLDAVVGLISNKVADKRISDLIAVCHVSFAMEPASLERLSGTGASQTILDALDQDTLLRLSLAQARAEVAALEDRKKTNESSNNTKRDAELRKSDTDFQVEYDKPKPEEKTTLQYTADRQLLKSNHEAARTRITAKYASDLDHQNAPLNRRSAVLKSGFYQVAGVSPTYVAYDADASRLTVSIGGEEFWFSLVPSRIVALKAEWGLVKVMQRYGDTDLPERFLRAPSTTEPLTGRTKSAIQLGELDEKITQALAQTKTFLDSGSYEKAGEEYARILTLDPNDQLKRNQTAIDGIAAAKKLIEEAEQRKAATAQFKNDLIKSPGLIADVWYDAKTDLLWTVKDNGSDVNWSGAKRYCDALTLGKMSGWRLATITELGDLYDISLPFKHTLMNGRNAGYRIRGDITMSAPFSWSSDKPDNNNALYFDFNGSHRSQTNITAPYLRTLCTRPLGGTPALSSAGLAGENLNPSNEAVVVTVKDVNRQQWKATILNKTGTFKFANETLHFEISFTIGADGKPTSAQLKQGSAVTNWDGKNTAASEARKNEIFALISKNGRALGKLIEGSLNVASQKLETAPTPLIIKGLETFGISAPNAGNSQQQNNDGAALMVPSGLGGSFPRVDATASLVVGGIPMNGYAISFSRYLLLNDDPTAALKKAGLRVPPGKTADDFMHDACNKSQAACDQVSQALTADSAAKIKPDPGARYATFSGIPPGTYYLVAYGLLFDRRVRVLGWKIDLKAGENSFAFPKNAH